MQTEVISVTLYIGSLYWFRNWSWSVGASPSYDSLSLLSALSNHWKSRGSKTVRIEEEIAVFLTEGFCWTTGSIIFAMTFLLITEVESIHSLMYSWLQAAQDFREKQDRKNNENLRKSYRIRLGGKKKITILWNGEYFEILECLFTYLLFTPVLLRKQTSLMSQMHFKDFLLRRPLNSVSYFFYFIIFFCKMSMTPRFAKVILLLVRHEVECFLSFIVTHHISFYWGTSLYLFLIFDWFLLIPRLFFKWNLKKDIPIWRRAFSFQVLTTKNIMFTATRSS